MQSVLKSGPVPWAGYQSIQFLAEQVSHHPPSILCYFHAVCCDYMVLFQYLLYMLNVQIRGCMLLGVYRPGQDFWDCQSEYKILGKVIIHYIIHYCIIMMSHDSNSKDCVDES